MRKKIKRPFFGASVLVTGVLLVCAIDVQAQIYAPGTVQPANPNDPNVQLANSLKILAQNPYNVDALLSAGKGALAAGDPNAAIGFLARAEELSPRNPFVKTALGAALVQVERPNEALRILSDASVLGVLDTAIASDRGLAHDLLGDTRSAQRDYAIAFKGARSDELIRRYALSLGISGEKSKAVDLLDPLTRRGDQAAWRAKAFVLAMNGDMPGADRIVGAVMPTSMAGIMTPFMRRLPSLTQAQRSRAVHFGTMPSASAANLAVVDPGDSFRAIGNPQAVASAAQPPVVSAAPPGSVARPNESSSDRRRRERQERELAKLAERGRRDANLPAPIVPAPQPVVPRPPVQMPSIATSQRPAPIQPPRQVAVAQPPRPIAQPIPQPITQPGPVAQSRPLVQTPPVQPAPPVRTPTPTTQQPTIIRTETVSPRLGARVGDADPNVLEPYLGPSNRPEGGVAGSARPVLIEGVRTLPAPSASPPVVRPLATPAQTLPPVAASSPAPIASQPAIASPPGSAASTITSGVAPRIVGTAPVSQIPPVVEPAPRAVVQPPITSPVASLPVSTPIPTRLPPSPVVTPSVPPSILAPVVPAATTPGIGIPNPAPGFTLSPTTAPQPSPGSNPVDPAAVSPVPAIVPPSAPMPSPTSAPVTPPEPIVKPTPSIPTEAAAPEAVKAETEPKGLESIVASLEVEEQSQAGPIPDDAEFRARQLAAKRKEDAAKAAAEKEARLKAEADAKLKANARAKADAKEKAEAEAAKKKAVEEAEAKAEAAKAKASPARVWVQVATGANRSGLPITWRKLKTDAPKALEGQSAYTVAFRATNRMLIGPFKSGAEARAMVNKLAKEGVFASLFSSEAGQEVARLGGR